MYRTPPGAHAHPVNAEDSARVRDLLASNRTLLAWLRTAVAFDGMGFAVARFRAGAAPDASAGLLGIAMVAIALLMTWAGLWQHQSMIRQESPGPQAPQPMRWPASAAAVSCGLASLLLAIYLAATAV
jgi:putative membrane protein